MNKFIATTYEKKIVYFKTKYEILTDKDYDEVVEEFEEWGEDMEGCVKIFEEDFEQSYEGVYETEIDEIS